MSDLDEGGSMNIPVRRADDAQSIKITREIPLWGIVSVLGAGFLAAVALFYQVQALTKEQAQNTIAQMKLSDQLTAMDLKMNDGRSKDQEHDFKISAIADRLARVELECNRPPTKK